MSTEDWCLREQAQPSNARGAWPALYSSNKNGVGVVAKASLRLVGVCKGGRRSAWFKAGVLVTQSEGPAAQIHWFHYYLLLT